MKVKYFDQNDKDSNLRQKENYTLRDISKDSSPIDVIIFKVGQQQVEIFLERVC
ncbi:hypothetical protein NW062_06565 [Mycoplasmopsis cynos]|nr:hypothetical protein NW062_06565 [Mycoplasmopsis cynos]